MGTRYVLAEFARHDRKEIFQYTFERSRSLEVAWRVDRKLEETFEQIAANPQIGHTRADLGIPEEFLVRRVYSYLVIYDPETSPAQILRIWHGAQEKPELP
jgi:plasmid stabilization system protein ParE